MVLSKEDILKADDRKGIEVSAPEWGGHVYLRPMSGTDRDDFEQRSADFSKGKREAMKGWRERLIVATACDDQGNPLFTKEDLPALAEKNSMVVVRLADEALAISGIGADEVEDEAGN